MTEDGGLRATTIRDLPADILYTIFPYLSAADFLAFTSSSKGLFSYRQDDNYWRVLTRKTFRIPPQPLLQRGRWQWLYKKLLTQMRLYTWGDNKSGNLGPHIPLPDRGLGHRGAHQPRRPRQLVRARQHQFGPRSGWPGQVCVEEDIGIVADVQCGGWCTTILSSIGALYMYGIFDGKGYHRGSEDSSVLKRLQFPPAYPITTKDRYEPSTAIQQYSTGRSSVLGLADDGKVWSWTQETGVLIKSVHVDLVGNKVSRVAAGWDRDSIYVKGTGIVYWASAINVVQGGRQETLAVADAMLIDTITIPGTGDHQNVTNRNLSDSLQSRIGEVLNHIVLEGYIVFTTHLNKIFCYPTTFPLSTLSMPEPVELTSFYSAIPQPFEIRDLQGNLDKFAIITHSNAILTAHKSLIEHFHHTSVSSPSDPVPSPPQPSLIPSLQTRSVVSLAFGDHHFLALHSNGTITSYGQELQNCGALGLGSVVSRLRGVNLPANGWTGAAGKLPPNQGRTVWVEPLMLTWLADIMNRGIKDDESKARWSLIQNTDHGALQAMGDFFEREGAKWEDGTAAEEEEMGTYFALKVAAAGWHSAALILVDEEKAQRARTAHLAPPPGRRSGVMTPAEGRDGVATPTGSVRSEDSYFHIESPSEQLANAVVGIFTWVFGVGRWFLGLAERDASREAAKKEGQARPEDGSGDIDEDGIFYTWSEDPFPRLRLPSGDVMPGEIPVME